MQLFTKCGFLPTGKKAGYGTECDKGNSGGTGGGRNPHTVQENSGYGQYERIVIESYKPIENIGEKWYSY